MQSKSEDVIKALMAMAVLYEKSLTEDAADMLLADLANYHPDDILKALKLCRLEMDRFPKISDIVKRIQANNSSNTQELIGRVFASISLCGYINPEGARKHIGETGWKAVMNFGGWKAVCDYPAENTMALRAQLGKAIESSINDDTKADLLGLPKASGDDVYLPPKEMKAISFDLKDYK